MDRNPWIPHAPHPRQRQFLLLADVLDVLYGGAAGGGKSDALLTAAAQYVHVPGYAAILLRQNFPDLMQPDALIPRSKAWWYGKAGWNQQEKRWTFPGGATITFGYLERDDDVFQYQGAAFQFVGIDELTQHTEPRVRYLFSRLRRPLEGPLAGVPLRFRAGSNPGGKGHEWVKKRYIDPATRRPGSVFVPARLADNPSLDAESYRRGLEHLDPLTRAQLLAGDWDAVAGGRFRRGWLRYYTRTGDYAAFPAASGSVADVRYIKPKEMPRFMTCDPAASEKRTSDYTVICVWAVTPINELVWLDCVRVQKEVPDIIPEIQKLWDRYRPLFVGIEQVAANSAVYQYAKRTKMAVKPLSPRGNDKLVRATPAIVLASTGRLWLPLGHPTFPLEDVEGELLRFTGVPGQDAHDDVVDNLSYAAECLGSWESRGGGVPSVVSTW